MTLEFGGIPVRLWLTTDSLHRYLIDVMANAQKRNESGGAISAWFGKSRCLVASKYEWNVGNDSPRP